MQAAVFVIALAFTALLGYLTVVDFVRHGATALGVLGALIVGLLATAIIGSLRHRLRR